MGKRLWSVDRSRSWDGHRLSRGMAGEKNMGENNEGGTGLILIASFWTVMQKKSNI